MASGGGVLDLLFRNKKRTDQRYKGQSSLGSSDHEMLEFRLLRELSKTNSRITALNFKTGDFDLFRDLFGRLPWESVLTGKRQTV